MAVTLSEAVLGRYRRFSCYNSPYPAHDHGCAIDCYPGTTRAPSPVAGTVLDVRTVDAPPRPYAAAHDHLLLVDTGEHVARILHVDPIVEPGDVVAVGDDLGPLVRAGFFAPWVDDHLHLGFREHDVDPYRASGSLPIDVDVAIEPLAWDGTGTVVEVSETYVVLDAPAHPEPGRGFVGIEADGGGVLDGGLPHYAVGGLLDGGPGPVEFLGREVGRATRRSDAQSACDVRWDDVDLLADGVPIHGLSLSIARDGAFGAKLVGPPTSLGLGDRVTVTIEPKRCQQ